MYPFGLIVLTINPVPLKGKIDFGFGSLDFGIKDVRGQRHLYDYSSGFKVSILNPFRLKEYLILDLRIWILE
jgi:hypothetical protein